MAEIKVRNQKNEEVRSLDLPDPVFAAPMRESLVHQAVCHTMAARRSGTASTKGRGEVRGSGRKLWRQKKTGRARIGSVRSPLWRKGGTVHGPTPRDYSFPFPRKMRRGALRSVVSQRLREGGLVVLDTLELASHRTKELRGLLSGLGLEGSTVLLVDEAENRNLELASRNLQGVGTSRANHLDAYDVLAHRYMVISESALSHLGERLAS